MTEKNGLDTMKKLTSENTYWFLKSVGISMKKK